MSEVEKETSDSEWLLERDIANSFFPPLFILFSPKAARSSQLFVEDRACRVQGNFNMKFSVYPLDHGDLSLDEAGPH